MAILNGVIYLLIGAFAGIIAGLFGIGGGLVVIPSLVFVFQQMEVIPPDMLMHVAVGTSLAIMIITSLSAVRSHHNVGNIQWSVLQKLWPGLIAGTISGSVLAAVIPNAWLKTFFGIFLLFVALKMLVDKRNEHSESFPKQWIIVLICFSIGLIAGLLGVGGGILIVPFMTYCGIPARKIAGISNSCAFTIALIGTITFIITGFHETATIPYTLGYVYWPAILLVGATSSMFAPIGTNLHYKLPIHQLRYGFIVLLILTSLKMLL
ncbi:sulfite exporter TauE/SafE family protein [Legionella rowbothamii]|uniref:sulfite exporter TauE/SafE family protein n=1 Tax=Legionella rowbothamii TaxID=96229 RepID=UPI0010542572|nr:sulfite exporter TauE/SafE family protein [Legionella rowbothamii]